MEEGWWKGGECDPTRMSAKVMRSMMPSMVITACHHLQELRCRLVQGSEGSGCRVHLLKLRRGGSPILWIRL